MTERDAEWFVSVEDEEVAVLPEGATREEIQKAVDEWVTNHLLEHWDDYPKGSVSFDWVARLYDHEADKFETEITGTAWDDNTEAWDGFSEASYRRAMMED